MKGLALLLLVLGVLADNHDATFSLDDFALFANLLDGRLYFHSCIPFLSVRLLFPPGDAALGEVVDRDLNRYRVTGQDLDIVHAELARNVGGHNVPVGQLDLEGGVRKCFQDNAVLKLDKIILRQKNPSPSA